MKNFYKLEKFQLMFLIQSIIFYFKDFKEMVLDAANELLPSVKYTLDGDESSTTYFKTEKTDFSNLKTQGKTNGPSEYLVNSSPDWVDRDIPLAPTDTQYGRLRGYLTTLQDEVNGFLTERMKKK